MGRHKKVLADSVLAFLMERGQVTIAELSNLCGVCSATIRARLKDLRKELVPLIHGKNGMLILDKREIENDDEIAKFFKVFISQQVGTLDHIALVAAGNKPYYAALKRAMKDELTTKQKKELSSRMVKLGVVVALIAEEEEAEA